MIVGVIAVGLLVGAFLLMKDSRDTCEYERKKKWWRK